MAPINARCGAQRVAHCRNPELQWASWRVKGKYLSSIVFKDAWRAAIYRTWAARSLKIHEAEFHVGSSVVLPQRVEVCNM
ncbi:STAS domain-containing protein [Psidium guajava]|nr:STAS domain-containing protein [Psidium guajava]